VNWSFSLVLLLLFNATVAFAQSGNDSTIISSGDSVIQQTKTLHTDSLVIIPATDDSIIKKPHDDSVWYFNRGNPISIQNLSWQILQHHPYFNFTASPKTIHTDVKQFHGKELLFYVLASLLLIYALLRRTFPKYFNDLFRLFFRTTLKQLQIREQLMQTPLPSAQLNVFFGISVGLYMSFLLLHGHLISEDNFWQMFVYCVAALSTIYLVKFMSLKVSGWLFNIKEATDSYIFIVFVINKMLGLVLLPFLILIAYTQGYIFSISFVLSWIIIVGLLIYRFALTYSVVRKQVKVNPFHFFLYLCAFEIAPLLLIYKGLLLFFHITA